MTNFLDNTATISPEEFEIYVQKIIENSGINLSDFKTTRREKLKGTDGEYEIDIVARFSALNTSFTVLIECKHHKNPIKREIVQILNDRVRSTCSQKGMLFTTGQYQSGAIEYANKNNIALVKITDKEPFYYNGAKKLTGAQRTTRTGSYLIRIADVDKIEYCRLELAIPDLIFTAFGFQIPVRENFAKFSTLKSISGIMTPQNDYLVTLNHSCDQASTIAQKCLVPIIDLSDQNNYHSVGTAVLIKFNEKIYLLTASHVISDEKKEYWIPHSKGYQKLYGFHMRMNTKLVKIDDDKHDIIVFFIEEKVRPKTYDSFIKLDLTIQKYFSTGFSFES